MELPRDWTFAYASDGTQSICRPMRSVDDPHLALLLASKAEGLTLDPSFDYTLYGQLPASVAWELHFRVRTCIQSGQRMTLQDIDKILFEAEKAVDQ